MLKICRDKWYKNEKVLYDYIKDNLDKINDTYNFVYKDMVKMTIDKILNEEDDFDYNKWDIDKIVEIDNGNYQGTLLYVIPTNEYQPSEYNYIMTYVYYGSCSGCDSLLGIQEGYYENKEDIIKDYMKLCRDIIVNIVKPYNSGWREDDKFNSVEGELEITIEPEQEVKVDWSKVEFGTDVLVRNSYKDEWLHGKYLGYKMYEDDYKHMVFVGKYNSINWRQCVLLKSIELEKAIKFIDEANKFMK